jgi:hypothetical protein
MLRLSDGTRTALEIVRAVGGDRAGSETNGIKWMEKLFVLGLISLRDREPSRHPAARAIAPRGGRNNRPVSRPRSTTRVRVY